MGTAERSRTRRSTRPPSRFRRVATVVTVALLALFQLVALGGRPQPARADEAENALVDTTVADFNAGTPGWSSAVTDTGNGEVILFPCAWADFDGTSLPVGDWTAEAWNDGGTATVANGSVVVDGSQVGSTTSWASGHLLDFTATFTADPYEHVGFATEAFNGPWALFSTGITGTALQVRTLDSDGGSSYDETIPGDWLGSAHHYSILWNADQVTFFVDGQQVAQHNVTLPGLLRVAASDFTVGGGSVTLDRMVMSPYVSNGWFTSRVLDAGAPSALGTFSADTVVPAATGIQFEVRSGNTAVPDATWTDWAAITPGQQVGATARYVQYMATMTSSDRDATPVLNGVSIALGASPPTNHAPVAADDSIGGPEDTALARHGSGVLGNDSDPDGDALTAVLVTEPEHGDLALSSDGGFTYTPDANWNGVDHFTYQASDGSLVSNVATVTITVSAVNDAPVITNPGNKSSAAGEAVNFAVSASDVDGDPVTFSATGLPPGVEIAPDGTVSGAASTAAGSPFSVEVVADDGHGGTDTATFSWTVVEGETAPVASDDHFTTSEDTTLTAPAGSVTANDHDADGDPLTAELVAAPAHGSLTFDADGGFVYRPAANWHGTDHFTYRDSDGVLSSAAATVTIVVTSVNDTPVAANDAYTTKEGHTLRVASPGVLRNDSDIDGDGLTARLVSAPAHGHLALAANGSLTYTPVTGWSGTDHFTYRAFDGIASSKRATVTITVTARVATAVPEGYRIVTADGQISSFGNLPAVGSASIAGHGTIVAMAATPTDHGAWLASSTGSVFAVGDARSYGSVGGLHLDAPIVGMAATPSGHGYWMVASDGGIFAFGDAHFYNSMGGKHLNQPIVGIASTPSGHGYWLVASDGGIFSFGDAKFYGSTGAIRLQRPVVGMSTTASGHGYRLVASDGGIFSFGDAKFYGSTGAIRLQRPVVGMSTTASGHGYWLVASDGGVFCFGDAEFYGSNGNHVATSPVVAMG